MDFRVLGQVAIGEAMLPRRRERDLLALLLAVRGAFPSSASWRSSGPRTPTAPAVQVAVSRLRSLLDPGTTGPGAWR